MINSFIMNQGLFANSGDVVSISKLIGNEEYKTLLDLSLLNFDKQKFALLYYDTTLTMFEKVSLVPDATKIFFDTILRDDDDIFGIVNKNTGETAESDETSKEEKQKKVKTIKINNNDTIHTYLFKTMHNVGVEALDKDADYPIIFIKAVDAIANSENQEQIVNILNNGLKIDLMPKDKLIWSLDKVMGISSTLNLRMSELNKEFDIKIKKYVADIPAKNKKLIVDLIDELINTTLILSDNVETEIRGMLIEQIHENKINTYKQLNQFMEVIESCKIRTENVGEYVRFLDFIKTNKTLNDRLKLSMECNEIQKVQQYYLLFEKYMKHLQRFFNNSKTTKTKK